MSDRSIVGYCPMGCGRTLFVGSGGHITCSYIPCPNPAAVDQILGDSETEHVVMLGETGFTVRHPLRERLGDALMACQVHERIAAYDGPPHQPGRYRVAVISPDDRWIWTPLDGKAAR